MEQQPDIQQIHFEKLTRYLTHHVTILKGDIINVSREVVIQLNSKLYDQFNNQYKNRLSALEEQVEAIVSSNLLLFPLIRIHALGNNLQGTKQENDKINMEFKEVATSVKTIDITMDKLEQDGILSKKSN